MALLALISGISIAVFIAVFPPAMIVFGLPAVLLIYIGLQIIWSCIINKNPAVVLDSKGLRVPGVALPIDWCHISSIAGSSVIGRIPFRIINIHLVENAPHPTITTNKFVALLGNMVGIHSMVNIRLDVLAIREQDLIQLINDYKSDVGAILGDKTITKKDKDMPVWYRLLNWGMVILLLLIFANIIVKFIER